MDVPADTLLDEPIEVPISAIEHYSYCPRQCALIHVEQTFDDNEFTIRGRLVHSRVDSGDEGVMRGVRVVRGIPIWSERLGIRGKADLVEMRPDAPYPVEYKVGPHRGIHAVLQLCAQALCLEEMLGVPVPCGALYSYAERHRREFDFTQELRQRTEAVIAAIRELLTAQRLPPAPNDARCRNCSLIHSCLPGVVGEPARVRGWQSILFTPLPLPRTEGVGGEGHDA